MKTIVTVFMAVCVSVITLGQTKITKLTERFATDKDVSLDVDTRYTDVVFETWSKSEVGIEAYVEGDVSKSILQDAADEWDLEVIGNSNFVRTKKGYGAKEIDLSDLEDMNLNIPIGEIVAGSLSVVQPVMEGVVGPLLEGLFGTAMPAEYYKELNKIEFDHEAYRRDGKAYLKRYEAEVAKSFGPDFDKAMEDWGDKQEKNTMSLGGALSGLRNIPIWPFGKTGSMSFDSDDYERNKSAYVNKLNEKYDTNVSVREVDQWLEEVEDWGDDFEKDMEKWGEEFEINMEGFEEKMEAWGENFEENFGKSMEDWGENFGKSMEKWGENFGEKMEKWAEENADEWEVNEKTDSNGNKSKSYHFSYDTENKKPSSKVSRVIKVKMPKKAELDLNVRYGKVKMVDVYNPDVDISHGSLAATTIHGGDASVKVAYSPVSIDNWSGGKLETNHVKNCTITTASNITLEADASDVHIKTLNGRGMITGSFGKLSISNVGANFENLSLILENSEMSLRLPETEFNFSYTGERNDLVLPKRLETQKMGTDRNEMINGFHKSRNTNNLISISAKFSEIVLK